MHARSTLVFPALPCSAWIPALALLAACQPRKTEEPPVRVAPVEVVASEPVPPAPAPEPPPPEPANDAIVIAGQRFSIGSPVVLWTDSGGYSAYGTDRFFPGEPRANAPTGLRYKPGRKVGEIDLEDPTLAELAACIDQFVLHFDVCGASRRCFQVLHDIRGLSVHFLLDIDGTLYQTLDLKETAWHARQSNARSVGIEIANIGAYPAGRPSALDDWYTRDENGWRIALPEAWNGGGVRTEGFVGRPARPERVQGVVQGELLEQFDFTEQQYETLIRLASVLCRELPRIEPDAPRDSAGRVRTDALEPEEWSEFRGILGHDHVTREKVDPGPALDWERFLERVRQGLEAP